MTNGSTEIERYQSTGSLRCLNRTGAPRSMPVSGSWHDSLPAGTPPQAPPLSTANRSRPSWEACGALTGTRSSWASNALSWSSPEAFLLALVVHAASVPDRKGGQAVLQDAGASFPRLRHIGADQGYTGMLVRWAAQAYGQIYGWTVQVVYPTDRQMERYAPEMLADLSEAHAPGFHIIPRRWVVERTFSWLGRQRRLSKDYERPTSTEETFMYLVGTRLLLARLAPA
jgi:transposase